MNFFVLFFFLFVSFTVYLSVNVLYFDEFVRLHFFPYTKCGIFFQKVVTFRLQNTIQLFFCEKKHTHNKEQLWIVLCDFL